MGDVRALNVWLSLSRCGDEAPGMDIVPRRLDHIVPTGTEGAIFEWSVSPQVAEEAAGEDGVLRPIFEPGDVLLFDELFLHSTAAEPSMKKSRMAIESWFFGASASPAEYSPACRVTSARRAAPVLLRPHAEDRRGLALRAHAARISDDRGRLPGALGRQIRPTVAPQLFPHILLERWEARRDEIQVVTGHFPLCTTELLDADFTVITVLRDPVERTLSYLRHHRDTTPADSELPARGDLRGPGPLQAVHREPHGEDALAARRGDDQRDDDRHRPRPAAAADAPSGRCGRWTSSASRRTSRLRPGASRGASAGGSGHPSTRTSPSRAEVPDSFRAADRRGQSPRHGALRVRAEAAAAAEPALSAGTEPAVADLEIGLPKRIAVGRGTRVRGSAATATSPAGGPARWRSMSVGSRQRVEHFRLPRDDVYERLDPQDPGGTERLPKRLRRPGRTLQPSAEPKTLEVSSSSWSSPAGASRASRWAHRRRTGCWSRRRMPRRPRSADGPEPRVAICMATYEPPADLLRIQLDSLRAQTHGTGSA